MDRYISMTFKTDEGKKSTIKIKKVKETVSEAEINNVMDSIINSNAFVSSTGKFVEKDSAELITINQQKFVLS